MYMTYTIYKTTNLLNGMFYIGKHQTEDPNDSYLGSGVYLKRAIAKYGKCNFKKEVLYVFDSEEEMNAKEKEIIDESLLKDPFCYNLMLGGEGGSTRNGRHHSLESRQKISEAVQKHLTKESHETRSLRQKEVWKHLREDTDRLAEINAKRSKSAKKNHIGHKISFQTRKKISDSLRKYNAKLGRKHVIDIKPFKVLHGRAPIRFVTNGKVEYRVNADEIDWYLSNGYSLGRNPNNKKPLALSNDAKDRSSGKGKLIIHNPITREVKRISPSEFQQYVDCGWKRGYRK